MACFLSPRIWRCFRPAQVARLPSNGYSTSTILFGRHHGSSFEKYQKARKSKKKKYIDPTVDRLGKVHSPPGMRIAQKIADSHQFEASLASNRHPAMWNDPYYEKLYEEIIALDPPPEIEGSLRDLLSVDPDSLLRDLELRAQHGQIEGKTEVINDRNMMEVSRDTEDIVKTIKANLRSSGKQTGDGFSNVVKGLMISSSNGESAAVSTQSAPIPQAPSVQEWNHLLRVYGAHGRAKDAIDVVNRLKGAKDFVIDESHYAALITACGDSGLKQQADAVFDDMRWKGISPSEVSWSALLHAQMKCGDLQASYAILDRMQEQGVAPNVATYTSLLTGIFKNAPRDECLNQANEVWFRFNLAGVQPNLLTYTAMIKCCCRSREIERALNLVDEMRQNSIRPSVVTYNSILRGLAYAPQWHRAIGTMNDEVLDMMQADEIPPTVGTFHALITSCASVGDVVNARVYFEEMTTKFGLNPDADIYNAMLFALGSSQAVGSSESSQRFLTRARAWPIIPHVGPPGLSASEKTSRLMWDFMDEEKGKKFKGFHEDMEFDEDSLEDEDENNLTEFDNDYDDDDDDFELSDGSGGSGGGSDLISLRDDNEGGFGLTWQQEMQKTRDDAKAIIEKGEKKRLARSKHSDIDFVEDVEDKPKKAKSRDKGVTGYKGAKTIEEEWELLVHEVYETVKDDPTIVPDTMAKLKNEVDKYPKTKAITTYEGEVEDLDLSFDSDMREEVFDLPTKADPLQPDFYTPSSVLPHHSLAEEDGMPWITTDELLSFDWEAADRNPPIKGIRYTELSRVVENMQESKAFSSMKNIKERHATNRASSLVLFSEMQEKGLEITVDTLNGMLSVLTKSMRAGAAVKFYSEEFSARKISPNEKTYRLLVELFIRKNNMGKAVELKEDMVRTMGCGDEEVFGMIIRKLADKNHLQEALVLLDEAQQHNLAIRERNKRELRRRLLKEGMTLHPLIGSDPEAWRKDAAVARRSLKKRDNKKPYILKNMMNIENNN